MKTCLVGCGGIAAVHGSVLTSGIDTEFVAAADIKPEKAQTYAENFHTNPYPSLESMLEAEKPDVLHICTPHYLHVPMAIYSLERNINVFMEKPPAISFDQLEELKKAAAKSEACQVKFKTKILTAHIAFTVCTSSVYTKATTFLIFG